MMRVTMKDITGDTPAAPWAALQSPREHLLSMAGISKSFSGVRVLREVDFDVRAGEVHVVAGENGAGKSTLINVLGGVHGRYEGNVFLEGRRVRFRSAAEAARHGISMIHQEMSLVPCMSVVDNIFLGRERVGRAGCVDRGRQAEMAGALLRQLGIEVDLRRPVDGCAVAVRQMVEIAKALAFEARVIVMDEPTSALNQPEVDRLFSIIEGLKKGGCGLVYITHKMEEIYRIADRVTVLRDGRRVGTAQKSELPRGRLIHWMVGRELTRQFPARAASAGAERLRLKGFSVLDPWRPRQYAARRVSLSVASGEVVGIAGLQGAGNHELLHGLFGAYGEPAEGQVSLDGKRLGVRSPADSIRAGVALLTNDRKASGLVLGMNVRQNATLASIPMCSPWGWLRPEREREAAHRVRTTMNVHLASLAQPVAELSGGNQQKVALGKWLETGPKVLLLDEPTRGVDVGAKKEIYDLMNRWTSQGVAILLITSEMPELLAMSDRIIVMHRGHVTAEWPGGEATQERVLSAAMGREGLGGHEAE